MKENKNQSAVVETAGSDDTEIDLVELFYVFLNRIWLLVICMAIGGAAAFAWTACFIKPVYKTSAEIYVVSASNNSVVNLTDLQIGNTVKTDYMELMLSRPVLEKVIESLNVNKTVSQIRSMVCWAQSWALCCAARCWSSSSSATEASRVPMICRSISA